MKVETFEARSGLEEPEELEFDFDSRIEQEIQKSCEIYEKFVCVYYLRIE